MRSIERRDTGECPRSVHSAVGGSVGCGDTDAGGSGSVRPVAEEQEDVEQGVEIAAGPGREGREDGLATSSGRAGGQDCDGRQAPMRSLPSRPDNIWRAAQHDQSQDTKSVVGRVRTAGQHHSRRSRDCVAGGGFAESAVVSGPGADRGGAGSLDLSRTRRRIGLSCVAHPSTWTRAPSSR